MPKALVLICGFVFAISTLAYGQETFTVSGEISFQEEKGEFLVWLKTQEEFEQEAKWAMAVKLFEMKRISSGIAANLLGVDRVTFLLKLSDYGVPMIDLSEDEILSDLANA